MLNDIITKIDLKSLKVIFPSAEKDAQRISLFLSAVAKKTLELAAKGEDPFAFIAASGTHIQLYFKGVKKWSIADLFRDPFAKTRQETRAFAKAWGLDQVFIDSMG